MSFPFGPFLNRQVFANELEAGFSFNAFNVVGGKTSIMIGGNVSEGDINNDEFYGAFNVFQILDSKLTAGFIRVYQDLYFLNSRIHIGGGIRNYSTPMDTGSSPHINFADNNFFSAQGAFDAVIIPDMKFYAELAMQKTPWVDYIGFSQPIRPVLLRPITMGLTIPTFGVVDTLAVEFENVGKTYFSDQSMRDSVSQRTGPTMALAWGVVVQKKFLNRFNIAWGLYTGDQYGDMAATLRLSTYF